MFKKEVESIASGKNQGYTSIFLTTKKLPELVPYQDLVQGATVPQDSFFVGESLEGIITQKIEELPHMLIAGSTGAGKSNFFKGTLLSLLRSSPHLQMYVIDLKEALETRDFEICPNVKVVKDLKPSVELLKNVEKEMKARFRFMEDKGYKNIEPGAHKRDRIIIAVDESSVLFSNFGRGDEDYNRSMQARKLIDSIAKLGRAAGISVILATQKLEKQVIPTSVSENVSARMAFKANSLQGSLQVVGNKMAMDLPEIKGRGIWCFGTKRIIVQTPMISDDLIVNTCKAIKQEFEEGKRKILGSVLSEDIQTEEKESDFQQNKKSTGEQNEKK